MPKPMYVWSGSAWVSVASEVESLATYATQSYADNQPGMKMIVPTSVAVGSGSGSIATQGTVTFSGASSVSLNGAFSSTYDNYRIVINVVGSSGVPDIRMRLRTSGTDNSASEYRMGRYYVGVTSALTAGSENATTATSFFVGQTSTDYSYIITELSNPQLARRKNGISLNAGNSTSFIGLGLNNTTTYDGFTIYPDAGTITGTIRVYGLKNG